MSVFTCPRRCFLADVSGIILQQQGTVQSQSLRLMGLAVAYKESTAEYTEITLDDGTALVTIHVPVYMIQTCRASVEKTFMGKLVECIVQVVNNVQLLIANQIAIIDDDPHAELVRWFELSWQPKLHPHVSTAEGYPSLPVTAEDVLEIIQLESNTTADSLTGVTLEELVLFFHPSLDPETIKDLLEELQMAGQIYQNQQGHYLPL